MKLEDRMIRSIKQRAGLVVLRADFSKMGSDSQVGRVLA
ncbi:S-adenosylhomocysteine hydrolase, partial [Pseudomonas corrugata]|nr:S-adenosylhomocysteine hydrolase [Pseudomonas corrugata]